MLEFLFTIGQAAAALLLVYGAFLVLTPARQPPAFDPQPILTPRFHADA
jgi:hypothetical protein